MGMKALLAASHAAGFAMASSEDPAYYGSSTGGARVNSDAALPNLPAAYVAANADRRPYRAKDTSQDVRSAFKSVSRTEWHRFVPGIGWRRVTA